MNGIINIRRIAAFLLAILPLLDMYSFPFLINNLGTVVQLVLVVILFFAEKPCVDDSRGQMILDKYYLFMLFCVFALVVSMVANINYGFNGRMYLS